MRVNQCTGKTALKQWVYGGMANTFLSYRKNLGSNPSGPTWFRSNPPTVRDCSRAG